MKFKQIILALVFGLLLTSCTPKTTYKSPVAQTRATNYTSIKYRNNGLVDLYNPNFIYQETTKSSFVNGLWYDPRYGYMIIKLNSTYYHYCDMDIEVWERFKRADSYGSFYNAYIKGRFDCRVGYVPNY